MAASMGASLGRLRRRWQLPPGVPLRRGELWPVWQLQPDQGGLPGPGTRHRHACRHPAGHNPPRPVLQRHARAPDQHHVSWSGLYHPDQLGSQQQPHNKGQWWLFWWENTQNVTGVTYTVPYCKLLLSLAYLWIFFSATAFRGRSSRNRKKPEGQKKWGKKSLCFFACLAHNLIMKCTQRNSAFRLKAMDLTRKEKELLLTLCWDDSVKNWLNAKDSEDFERW